MYACVVLNNYLCHILILAVQCDARNKMYDWVIKNTCFIIDCGHLKRWSVYISIILLCGQICRKWLVIISDHGFISFLSRLFIHIIIQFNRWWYGQPFNLLNKNQNHVLSTWLWLILVSLRKRIFSGPKWEHVLQQFRM